VVVTKTAAGFRAWLRATALGGGMFSFSVVVTKTAAGFRAWLRATALGGGMFSLFDKLELERNDVQPNLPHDINFAAKVPAGTQYTDEYKERSKSCCISC
jgi:hypothetical protein